MITPADAAAWQNASPVALNAAQAEQEMLLRRHQCIKAAYTCDRKGN